MVRIALVSDVYQPRLGGMEVQVADLAVRLRGAGHQVRVVTATSGEPQPGVLRLSAPVSLPAPVNPWAGPGLRAELAMADVVHIHLGMVAPFASRAARLALAAGRPTVVTWHSMLSTTALPYAARWRGWIRSGAVPTAVSVAAAERVQAVTRSQVPIAVLPNGIELVDWAPGATPAPALAPGAPVRLATALRFAPRKRPLQLVALALRIRRLVPPGQPLELVMAGAGPLLAPARARAQLARADWITLPGRLPRAELARLYHRSHLYLSPARLESFGIAALEARTAGLAVAGIVGSGITEFVQDRVEGVLADDGRELAEVVAGLINEPDRLARILAHNRSTAPAQSWDRVVEATVATYGRVLAARRRGP